jgi:hypothetical protein
MSSPSHSAPIRAAAVLLLLWVGIDLGAHGLSASDFHPVAASASTGADCAVGGEARDQSPDHCFCHSQSLGATLSLLVVRTERADALVSVVSCQAPRSTAGPLYHPPQTLA